MQKLNWVLIGGSALLFLAVLRAEPAQVERDKIEYRPFDSARSPDNSEEYYDEQYDYDDDEWLDSIEDDNNDFSKRTNAHFIPSIKVHEEGNFEDTDDIHLDSEEAPSFIESQFAGISPDALHLAKSRVRRRIVGGGGGVAVKESMSRRGDRRGDSRSRVDTTPWKDSSRQSSMGRARGPQGSELLYSLYPELKPGNERQDKPKSSNPKKKKAGKKQDKNATLASNGTSPTQHDDFVMDEQSPRRKLTKELKDEIAEYALAHGTDEALAHYRNEVDKKLKKKSITKFIKRYRKRESRRKDKIKEEE